MQYTDSKLNAIYLFIRNQSIRILMLLSLYSMQHLVLLSVQYIFFLQQISKFVSEQIQLKALNEAQIKHSMTEYKGRSLKNALAGTPEMACFLLAACSQ